MNEGLNRRLENSTDYFLPKDYNIREAQISHIDIRSDLICQPDVYQLAEYLAKGAELDWIVAIGCGLVQNLVPMSETFSVIGIDSPAPLETVKELLPGAKLITHDLEEGLPYIPDEVLSRALVICSDVIEHLQSPGVLMSHLAALSEKAPYIIISTPDRDRVRGWLDQGPPKNSAHVMEWNGNEFMRFMRKSGFSHLCLFGHTVNTNHHLAKNTLVSISGTQVGISESAPRKKIAAIMHVYNEADILPETIRHLVEQGIEVHVFDNWSTDGTWDFLQQAMNEGMIKSCVRFPEKAMKEQTWVRQLDTTTAYAQTLDADWIIHHDADEIRESPWTGMNLRQAISNVDALGFNAIDFTVLDFRFLGDQPNAAPPYQESLNHFEFGRRPGHFLQIKCWKNGSSVNLSASGGHEAIFDGRKVYPIKFLLKHYPLRNKTQAGNKVFVHRLPRYNAGRVKAGWHAQYASYLGKNEIKGWNRHELKVWHAIHFKTEYIVERISGIGLVDHTENAMG